ncbi:MAG: bifunctional phosphoribosylaminoimidazolecarboxamide formyltransferase/IMP cyclohydrolase, partial [Thermoplasmata archaeon]|nr:bifunctional phosphoribosylaminoimidazolecarboxamide formyltransferase/IMP cyclohydrolase [Thermoplasmata archaeon]
MVTGMVRSRTALLSTSNKEGLVELAKALLAWDYTLIASGGTASHLGQHGLPIRSASDLTGWKEMLGGRVKTLHPALLAGILARPDEPGDRKDLDARGLTPIDVVAVNLYPLDPPPSETDVALLDAMDIGGVTLVRAAAKNFPHVSVLTDPSQYPAFIDHLAEGKGTVSVEARRALAEEALALTSRYEAALYNRLAGANPRPFPKDLRIAYDHAWDLRYGENPYQSAAFYRDPAFVGTSVATSEEVFGRGLSFNNILDLNAALELAMKFDRPTAAIVKHTDACGVASADALPDAYRHARATDPKSAYGCVVGFNRPVDRPTAEALRPHFVEGTIAPNYTADALEVLASKKKLRALRTGGPLTWEPATQAWGIRGGMLVQARARVPLEREDLKVVSRATPTEEQVEGMLFAHRVLGSLKSNAIVLAKGERTVGLGAGQASRVD